MPTGKYKRTEKHIEALKKRKIPIRTIEWNKKIGDALRKGRYKICICGKQFFVHPYRDIKTNYCSMFCQRKNRKYGQNKGKKIIAGTLAKLGDKNPHFGKHPSKIEQEKRKVGLIKMWDRRGRSSKEHKLFIRNQLENIRQGRLRERGKVSFLEWQEIKQIFNHTCPACKKKEPEIKLTIDHIIPISKNGTNIATNIQPLCRRCNSKKRTNIIKYEPK